MKRLISQSNNPFVAIWAIFHSVIILAFLISLLGGKGINLDADLFSMIPDSGHYASRMLSQSSSRNVFILVSHSDFGCAKKMAEYVYGSLVQHTGQFDSLTLSVDMGTASELEEFIFDNRYRILPEKISDDILSSEQKAIDFADSALMTAYSSFSLVSLGRLERDPFLLADTEMRSYISAIQNTGTGLSIKDGVLAAEYEGNSYVLIRGTLSEDGARLASRSNAVRTIYDTCLPLEKDGYRFVFSGTAFHSYESSLSASREITLISSASLLLLLVILLFVFRSVLPIAMSFSSIVLSVLVSFCATHFFFGNVQALTMVFGTSLIGCCIDYSLHFFMHWKANTSLSSGSEIRRLLFKGLFFSFISTQACYILLFFMPFPLLKQISLFSFTGISSSFLTTLGLYPLFNLPQERGLPDLCKKVRAGLPRGGKFFIYVLMVAAVSFIAIKHDDLIVHNDLTSLYSMKGRLKEDSILSYNVMRYSPTSYFIIDGKSEQEVLVREEELCAKLGDDCIAKSCFVPSQERQRKSLEASQRLLGLAARQYNMLSQDGYDPATLISEFEQEKDVFLSPDGKIPESIRSVVGMLWLGKIDENFCSIVIANTQDENLCRTIADEMDGVYFENKVKEINISLDWLTSHVLMAFALAYILVLVLIKTSYGWKQLLRIALVPIVSIALILTVFLLAGYSLDFFCTAGMVLVFGLGLDYVIYMTEREKRKECTMIEPFAVFLSFVTTELSFGALALSSFVPVNRIGICIFTGCLASFLCVGLFLSSLRQENCTDE
ncbi:MAG: MMPL family transporter [Treponema sp.]|nr:MMPL family transporter [Treponema sp.]